MNTTAVHRIPEDDVDEYDISQFGVRMLETIRRDEAQFTNEEHERFRYAETWLRCRHIADFVTHRSTPPDDKVGRACETGAEGFVHAVAQLLVEGSREQMEVSWCVDRLLSPLLVRPKTAADYRRIRTRAPSVQRADETLREFLAGYDVEGGG